MSHTSSNITWPTPLPLPTVDGYAITPGDAIVRTDMDAGAARQRRRFTQVPSRVAVRWLMRQGQFALFEAWYRWHAKEGGAWFSVTLLGGIGLQAQQARFTRQFHAQLLTGTLWEIQSELEIRERPVFSEDTLSLLLTEDARGLMQAIDSLHRLVHRVLPIQLHS